ncbi:sideroflexin-1 [Caerostris extrusa]|uniref:Sideroflexin-1 n=1 Tax=Caerostris extrusa TaxID=172846 RepID=A0AAV4RW10_CAEEX|nr:sideroflexin-1 [Caerostris extrusa]
MNGNRNYEFLYNGIISFHWRNSALIPPFIMNYLDKKGVLMRYPWINAPLQVGLCGLFLIFATPLCCALFPQQSSISIQSLEPEIQEAVAKLKIEDKCLYYNKGL